MARQARTDIHRPSALIPADYVYVMDFSQAVPELRQPAINRDEANAIYRLKGAHIHGGIFSCDVCGARYTYGTLFAHAASGQVISIGHDCADKLEFLRDSGAAERTYKQAKAASMLALQRIERHLDIVAWARANRSLLRALRCKHSIVKDIRARLISTGCRWGLSAKQAELVLKLDEQSRQPAEKHVAAPATTGRTLVEGRVVSAKLHDSDYGSTMKITVKVETAEGSWLAWGTLPAAIEREACAEWSAVHQGALPTPRDLLTGRKVAFEASLVQGRDPHFAIFKRPTQAKLIAG